MYEGNPGQPEEQIRNVIKKRITNAGGEGRTVDTIVETLKQRIYRWGNL